MSSKNLTNINDYTLIEIGDLISNIYFYPGCALNNQKIRGKKEQLCVLFELKREKEPQIFCMHTYLLDKEGYKVFMSYSIYLKEISPYRFVVLNNKADARHAEIIQKEVIDFNILNYENFLKILSQNNELSKMIPDLKEGIEAKVESLETEKRIVSHIDIPSPQNYYQNITGFLIDELAKQITTEDELELSSQILRNIKKNYEIVLYDKSQVDLAYTSIYAILLNKIKSAVVTPTDILDVKEIKTDTNKTSLSKKDLDYILNTFIESLKDEDEPLKEDLNIIQERIEYILTSKPKLKEVTNFIKVILIDNEYVDKEKRNRSIKESILKDLIIKSFENSTYRSLPRNEVLLYNQEDDNVNFVCIASVDKIYELLHTFRHNTQEENKPYIKLLKTIDNIVTKGSNKQNEDTLTLSVLILLQMVLYNYHNINNNLMLFNKGNYILKLDHIAGEYDVKVINRLSEKKHGKLTKFSESRKQLVKNSLSKGEKSFNTLINKLILDNIEVSLNNLLIDINIKELTNKGISIKINSFFKTDGFNCEFNLGQLLSIISNIKLAKEKIQSETTDQVTEETVEAIPNEVIEPSIDELDIEEETTQVVEEQPLTEAEKEYIIRKSHTIVTIMSTNPIENENYKKIVELYKEYEEASEELKDTILNKIKPLL